MDLIFSWNGVPVTAREGDTILSTLVAARAGPLGRSNHGRERGAFCGIGLCQDCLVRIDGRPSLRACMTEVRNGMTVEAQDDIAPIAWARPPDARPRMEMSADLAIVGAGPAGLTAAVTAAGAGVSVVVIDERGAWGGQYFKPRSSGFRGIRPPDAQHRAGDALRAAARASDARFLDRHTV